MEITNELAAIVLHFGGVHQQSSEPMTEEQHVEMLQAKMAAGRAMHSDKPDKTCAHGIFLDSLPFVQLALVGNSPNSAPVSKALAIAWNRLREDCEEWLQQQEQIESRKREEAA